MYRTIAVILSILMLAFAACVDEAPTVQPPPDGDEGGQYETGDPLLHVEGIYPEDPNPPIVLADAPVDTDLVILFSKPVDISTITPANIHIAPATPSFNVSFFAGDAVLGYKGVRIDLTNGGTNPLAFGTTYNVTLNKDKVLGILADDPDPETNYLNQDDTYQYQFTTGSDTSADLDPVVIAVTRYPADLATDVSRELPYVEVTFSKDMDGTTITPASFQVIDNSVPTNITASITNVDNRTFRANLPPLSYNQNYTVNLTAAITDDPVYGSNPLVLDGYHTWSFTTETQQIYGAQGIGSVWVTDISDTQATVYFTTNNPVATNLCSVDFGNSTAYGSSQVGVSASIAIVHSITITLPTHATKYWFQINVPTLAPQSTDPVTGDLLAFITEDDGTSNNPVSVNASDKSELAVLQHNNRFSLNGSSFAVWKDGTDNDIYGQYFDTDGSIGWAANGMKVDDTHDRINIRIFTDFLGYAIVTLEEGGAIYAKRIYHTGATLGFDADWGNVAANGIAIAATGTKPSAVVWGAHGTNNVDSGFVTRITSGTTEMDIPANPFYNFDSGVNLYNEATNDILYRNSSNIGQPYISSNYRHVMGQNPNIGIGPGVNYYIGDWSNNQTFTATDHTMRLSGNFINGGNMIYGPFGYTWAGGNDIIDDGPSYGRITGVSTISESCLNSGNEQTTRMLVDVSAPFGSVADGDFVINTTDLTFTYVSGSPWSNRELRLVDNRFTWNEDYEVMSYTEICTGSSTSYYINGLYDSAANFTASGVQAGDYVTNNSSGEWAQVNGVYNQYTLLLDSELFPTTGPTYRVLRQSTLRASGTMNRTNHVYNYTAPWGSVDSGDLVLNLSTGTNTTVQSWINNRLLRLNANRFTGGNKSYAIYDDWDTSDLPTTATPRSFEAYTIDHSVNFSDGNSVTVYHCRDSGTAQTPPANPLYDDGADFSVIGFNDDDVVINIGDLDGPPNPNIAGLNVSGTFGVRTRALDLTLNIMDDGEEYWILRFLDPSQSANVLESGYTTSTVANELRSTVSDFVGMGVEKGDLVYNITDDTYAVVVSRDSATQLTLNKDIFAVNDRFIIFKSDLQLIETGTVTAVGIMFTDSSARFDTSDPPVDVGDVVYNNSTGQMAYVTNVNSATQLTLSSNIMTAVGQRYCIVQPRVLFAYERSNDLYGVIIRLKDGSVYRSEFPICTAAGTQQNVRAVDRGFGANIGGAFVVYESGTNIYAKRIDADGTIDAGDDAANGGLGVSIAGGAIIDVFSDNSGLFYVLYKTGFDELRLTRRNADITVSWDVSVASGVDDAAMMLSYSSYPTVAYSVGSQVFVQQFDGATGATRYTSTNVVDITLYAYYSNLSITATPNTDGAIVSWIDDRYFATLGFTVMAQAVDATGTRLWNADPAGSDYDGILIGIPGTWETADVDLKALFFNDTASPWGGLFLWYDYRNGRADIFYDMRSN